MAGRKAKAEARTIVGAFCSMTVSGTIAAIVRIGSQPARSRACSTSAKRVRVRLAYLYF